MTAAVVEHSDRAIIAPDHQDRLRADIPPQEIADLRDFAFVPDIHPDLVPDLRQLALKNLRIPVETAVDATPLTRAW